MSTPSQRLPSAVRFLRSGSVAALLSAVFAAIGFGFSLLATGGSVRRLLVVPDALVSIGVNAAEGLRFGALFWLFGLALAFLVTALAVRLVVRARHVVAGDLLTLAAIGAAIAAGFGALMIASIGPALIEAFAKPSPATDVSAVADGFRQLTDIAIAGLWQIVFVSAAGVWWIGIGLLVPWERTLVKPLAIVIGACGLVSALARGLGQEQIAGVAFTCFIVVWIVAMVLVSRELRVPILPHERVGDPRMN